MAAWKAISALFLASVLLADAVEHGGVKFGYSGSNGPDKWGSLSPAYRMCSKGKSQSPINIDQSEMANKSSLEALERNYVPANATLVNKGYQVGLLFDDNVGTLLVHGQNYSLKSVHWHSPSEHTIHGKRFSAELHMVHTRDNGSTTVVAILYHIGQRDPFVHQIEGKLKELANEARRGDEEAHISVGVVQTMSLKRHGSKYYRYSGSLTTPPCTENVTWSILGKVREMSKEQLAALQAPLSQENRMNARPTQPLNHRAVQLYHDSRKHDQNSRRSYGDYNAVLS